MSEETGVRFGVSVPRSELVDFVETIGYRGKDVSSLIVTVDGIMVNEILRDHNDDKIILEDEGMITRAVYHTLVGSPE